MHQGQIPGQPAVPFSEQQTNYQNGASTNAISGNEAVQQPAQASIGAPANGAKGEGKSAEASTEKKSKKDKDNVRLVYSDSEVSPEEKMAKLPRYAFDPKEREETVLGDPTPAVTGVVSGSNDPVRDSNRGPGKDN